MLHYWIFGSPRHVSIRESGLGSVIGVVGGTLFHARPLFENLAEFLLYRRKELWLLVSVIEGYRSTLDHVFILSWMDIAANTVIIRMFSSF